MNTNEHPQGEAPGHAERLRAENRRLRRESDQLRQLLQSSAAVADDLVRFADHLADTRDLARDVLAGIRLLGPSQSERLLDLAHELAVALEDPKTGQCHACGRSLIQQQHARDCPAARFARGWGA